MTDLLKPIRRVARNLRVPHGIKPDLVVTLHPGGLIGLRESGRRKEYALDIGELYRAAVVREFAEARKNRRR